MDFEIIKQKIEEMKKKGDVDLSLDEDLSIAIMNLVSLEEHFFFTAEKTKKDDYFNLLREVREMRRELLGKMMTQNEGETWCISKHLLATSMRLMEVGTKLEGSGKREEAKRMFDLAYKSYAMFFGIRLKLVDISSIKKIDDSQLSKHDTKPKDGPWSFEDIVEKMVDCCDESDKNPKH
ncbi:MAG: hypothetical protein LiPW41_387 [Parcubacteria group bacterium LiPW_41]|nr:MAG: hypothetical protein LiPW41_387 [Parcubacteria group bacterium LiPW_41]